MIYVQLGGMVVRHGQFKQNMTPKNTEFRSLKIISLIAYLSIYSIVRKALGGENISLT